ncbi:MAG: TIGR01548 family HAD-type hydrolase [archaeon]|jgi:HAD superfamily phosphatase
MNKGFKGVLIFDIDGVLVDVSNSYRQAIAQTTEYFTQQKVLSCEIQELKQQTGFNNDWDLTEALIKKRGGNIEKQKIIEKFQDLYLGANGKEGLIANEKWMLDKEILVELSKKYLIGIVTGRPREEAFIPLRKAGLEEYFRVVVAMEDCVGKSKPNPFGINLALEKLGAKGTVIAYYIGDALDDVRAAKSAGIIPIGSMPPGNSSIELKKKMRELGAVEVVNQVNEIVKVV